ncbi:MAG: CRISPR system precrRNA processing endoribonuclease RAMP protein Cas6 [Proteobacteria bacterium]|nr:CRISPR system precrRNA processing endoribonuclease RAMP protein Cas6 [Pseudomonadota bacterium]
MAATLTIGRFELTVEAKEPIILPPYKGSTLRGGFGNAFRRVVCVIREKECKECLLKGQCIYSYVFETPPPAGTKVMRKYEAAPHPFVIEPPKEKRMGYKPGDAFSFGLTLIGKAVDYLPYFIYTFDQLGGMGIGKGRGKFELKEVRSLDNDGNPSVIYSSKAKTLKAFNPEKIMVETEVREPDQEIKALTISFLTPTRLYYNERLVSDLEFHILVRQLLRRISLLSYFHCGIEASVWDFKGLINRSLEVKVTERKLRWYNWERYSARQESKINMGGFVGNIAFSGDLTPFWPYLLLGEYVHVGKGSSFGLGKYEILNHSLP